MKIIKEAKPGKIMPQPPKNPNSGKLDSQIFIGKEEIIIMLYTLTRINSQKLKIINIYLSNKLIPN